MTNHDSIHQFSSSVASEQLSTYNTLIQNKCFRHKYIYQDVTDLLILFNDEFFKPEYMIAGKICKKCGFIQEIHIANINCYYSSNLFPRNSICNPHFGTFIARPTMNHSKLYVFVSHEIIPINETYFRLVIKIVIYCPRCNFDVDSFKFEEYFTTDSLTTTQKLNDFFKTYFSTFPILQTKQIISPNSTLLHPIDSVRSYWKSNYLIKDQPVFSYIGSLIHSYINSLSIHDLVINKDIVKPHHWNVSSSNN